MTHVTCRLTANWTEISSGTLRSVIEYGHAFCACVSQVAAVGNITVYVRRYYVRHDVRRILTVVPGLEAKMASAAASGSDDQPEAAEAAAENRIAGRPTAGTSHALF